MDETSGLQLESRSLTSPESKLTTLLHIPYPPGCSGPAFGMYFPGLIEGGEMETRHVEVLSPHL